MFHATLLEGVFNSEIYWIRAAVWCLLSWWWFLGAVTVVVHIWYSVFRTDCSDDPPEAGVFVLLARVFKKLLDFGIRDA
ncbi:hypothetical protein FQN55_007818 [Onygenales sp. PD_40]|nr:hypothetical protein FQN55_007818 [Onygenales sp. PD_40]